MRTTNNHPFATEAEADAFLLALRQYYRPDIERTRKVQQGNEWVVQVDIFVTEPLPGLWG
jgi:hypothetical protein